MVLTPRWWLLGAVLLTALLRCSAAPIEDGSRHGEGSFDWHKWEPPHGTDADEWMEDEGSVVGGGTVAEDVLLAFIDPQ